MPDDTPMPVGHAAAFDRLREEADRIDAALRVVAEARRCRDLLIGKLRTAGYTVRQIAPVAHVTNVRVSQVRRQKPS